MKRALAGILWIDAQVAQNQKPFFRYAPQIGERAARLGPVLAAIGPQHLALGRFGGAEPWRRGDHLVADFEAVSVAVDGGVVRIERQTEAGYDVVAETGRGDEAVELVGQHGPELAILDVKMPGLDGIAAALGIGDGLLLPTPPDQRALNTPLKTNV